MFDFLKRKKEEPEASTNGPAMKMGGQPVHINVPPTSQRKKLRHLHRIKRLQEAMEAPGISWERKKQLSREAKRRNGALLSADFDMSEFETIDAAIEEVMRNG